MPSGEKLRNSIPAAKVGGGGLKPAPPLPHSLPAPPTAPPHPCPRPAPWPSRLGPRSAASLPSLRAVIPAPDERRGPRLNTPLTRASGVAKLPETAAGGPRDS